MGGNFDPDVIVTEDAVEFEDGTRQNTFQFTGFVFVRLLTGGGAQSHPIVRCPDQSVTMALER